MKKVTLLWICLSGVFWLSCRNDDTPTGTSSTNDGTIGVNQSIDPAFLPFVTSFISEMEPRGFDFTNNRLTVVFVNELTAPNSSQFCAYGYPNFNGTEGARVEVLRTSNCWNKRDYTERENLIFHELGHALRTRGHFTGDLPNGMPISIMCTESCSNYRVYTKYQNEQRSYYLDEMATPGTARPNWTSAKTFSGTLHTDLFDNGDEHWQTTVINDANDQPFTFYVEADQPLSPPFSLGIESNPSAISSQEGYWYRYFDITDFGSCSNLFVKADIKVNQLIDGYIALVVEQVSYESETPEHFGRSVSIIDSYSNGTQNFEDVTVKSLCLPDNTDAIRVWLYMKNATQAKVLFDNIEIDLYE